MARNTARIGCVPMISRARSSMLLPPAGTTSPAFLNEQSAGATPRGAELFEHAIHQLGRRRLRIGELVVEPHRLPLEGTELMERLHLDPLDILHRRDEAGDLLYVLRIVGEAGHESEPDPYGLAHEIGRASCRDSV